MKKTQTSRLLNREPDIAKVIGVLGLINEKGGRGKLLIVRLSETGEVIGQHTTNVIDFASYVIDDPNPAADLRLANDTAATAE